jgi:RecA-family ATPase
MDQSEYITVDIQPDIKPPKGVDLAEFLKTEYPPVKDILAPILQERGALMIHGPTGCGKTQFVAGLAAAICSGGQFLAYKCSEPKSVVFCDFECQAATMQKRIGDAFLAVDKQPGKPFWVVTPDLSFPEPMPDLSTTEGRAALGVAIKGYDVVIIDNISTSFRSLRENDAEGWQEMANWILQLRGAGQSVILIQHEGKSAANGYRGHSKQGDVPDNIVQLGKSSDPEEGVLRFDVKTVKCRHHEKPRKFGARMETVAGKPVWSIVDLDWSNKEAAAELFKQGVPPKDVAAELGISVSQAYRLKKATKP